MKRNENTEICVCVCVENVEGKSYSCCSTVCESMCVCLCDDDDKYECI